MTSSEVRLVMINRMGPKSVYIKERTAAPNGEVGTTVLSSAWCGGSGARTS